MTLTYRVSLAAVATLALLAGLAAFTPAQTSQTGDGAFSLLTADAAAVDYFLKIEGVDGESTDKGHKNEIDVLSWSWGETNSTSLGSGGAGAGKVIMQDFHFTKTVDKASPKLFLHTADGRHFPKATLTVRRTERPQEYLKIELENVLVSSYQVSGSGGTVPTDSFSLNFEKIKWTYQTESEVIQDGWDLGTNTRI